MLVINNKVHLNKTYTAVLTNMNVKVEKIIADILDVIFTEDSNRYNANFSNILYLTSENIDSLSIDEKYFELLNNFNLTFPIKIDTCPAYAVESPDFKKNFFSEYDIIILGFINNISENIFNIVKSRATGKKIYIFGDAITNSPEHNNYYMRHLTSASMVQQIKDFDNDFRISDKKRLNIALRKLRKDTIDLSSEIKEIHNTLKIEYNDTIDTNVISEFLDANESSLVVVPKRFLPKLNSALYYSTFASPHIEFREGDTYYTKYPYTFTNEQGFIIVVPALSQITILNNKSGVYVENHRCNICDISIQYTDSKGMIQKEMLMNVAIDLSAFLLNFNIDDHPDNASEYEEIINNLDDYNEFSVKLDSTILSLVPFRILNSETAKYNTVKSVLSYIELIEKDIMYISDTSYFKHFTKVTDFIHIIYTDEFRPDII